MTDSNLFSPPRYVEGSLVGVDGNAFMILAYFRKNARSQGWDDADINTVLDAAKASGRYTSLISIIDEHLTD